MGSARHSPNQLLFMPWSKTPAESHGSFTPSARLQGRRPGWLTSPDTRTAWAFPTRACTNLTKRLTRLSFAYKDYADSSRRKRMTLCLEEFIRGFRLHILPPRFVKICHYGLLSTRNRHAKVAIARALLAKTPQTRNPAFVAHPRPSTLPPTHCPACGQPTLILVCVTRFTPAAPAFDSS